MRGQKILELAAILFWQCVLVFLGNLGSFSPSYNPWEDSFLLHASHRRDFLWGTPARPLINSTPSYSLPHHESTLTLKWHSNCYSWLDWIRGLKCVPTRYVAEDTKSISQWDVIIGCITSFSTIIGYFGSYFQNIGCYSCVCKKERESILY